ncbi:MAG: VPDSG-CTERM sorting domain-containing protein [Verrucomicrobiales bacterium]
MINAATYTFTASGNGPVTAYFAGSTAGYGSVVGLSINGGPVTLWGLQNNSTALGTSFVMGNVSLGDNLEFIFSVDTGNSFGPADPDNPSYFLSSDENDNPVAGSQHIYSTAYAGGDFGIPAGTYVGVEDISPLTDPDNDLDYDDHQFVFTGPGLSQVPEGGSAVALLGLALAGIGALRRRMK